MDYEFLLKKHKEYGSTAEDIIQREGFEKILDKVVIAPWWDPVIFKAFADKIEKVGDKVHNIYCDGLAFSFISMKNVGAPAIVDEIFSLGVTKCKHIIFLGSAGALSEEINIGDLAVPRLSVQGVGACRYLNDNLQDDFESKCFPDKALTDKILEVIGNSNFETPCHYVDNYSVDCVFAQFPHIEHFQSLGCKTIEMETSTLFRCASLASIASSAIFCISDNTVRKKSLYSGRTDNDKIQKAKTKNEIIPKIVIDVFKSL